MEDLGSLHFDTVSFPLYKLLVFRENMCVYVCIYIFVQVCVFCVCLLCVYYVFCVCGLVLY